MKLRTKAKYTDDISALETANRELSYQAASEAIVLLENNGILPLTAKKVALYGAGAGKTIKGGSGSGEVTERHAVTIWEGLQKHGFTVTTESWLRRYDELWKKERESFVAGMRKKLKKISTETLAEMMAAEFNYPFGEDIRKEDLSDETDVCIYVLSRQSGEASDRSLESFTLSDAEKAHLITCSDYYKHVILIINTGASMDLSYVKQFPNIDAIIYSCQLGEEGGNAVCDVLTGEVNPSGKLASTWVKKYEDVPFAKEYSYLGFDAGHAVYKEGIYVGYRYYDSFGIEPAYPFGHGLSYTNFEITPLDITMQGCACTVNVSVRNVGNCVGKETVQLYVSAPSGKLDREYQSLAAFAKTGLLGPGSEETVELRFDLQDLAAYDEETASMILEAGDYVLRIGNSSRNTVPYVALKLNEEAVISCHRNLCTSERKIQQIRNAGSSSSADLRQIVIDPSCFVTEKFEYGEYAPEEDVELTDILKKMSAEDLIKFCAGDGLLAGNAGFKLPGSVGNTTSDFWNQGIPNVTFCDGPAGIRLQRRSTADKNGKVKPIDGALSIYEYLPAFVQKYLFGNPTKEKMLYQFVTSFPVATAMAQTWNLSLAEKVGEAISREMSEYGVVFWLAPALNIIRNPLCGRNYEYYSEDPLISGKMAAAVIRGVQSAEGNYATVKHFAANNQEENRYYVSSDMDERTLREIYLRGFRIAVRETQPKAIMTAYNKINGKYCCADSELIDMILRREWGFDGIVMTDWLSTGEDRAANAECIANGTNLIMPGGNSVRKDLKKAYKKGELSRESIFNAAYRVLRLIMNSQIKTD